MVDQQTQALLSYNAGNPDMVRRIVQERGLSQEQVAQAMNLSPEAAARYGGAQPMSPSPSGMNPDQGMEETTSTLPVNPMPTPVPKPMPQTKPITMGGGRPVGTGEYTGGFDRPGFGGMQPMPFRPMPSQPTLPPPLGSSFPSLLQPAPGPVNSKDGSGLNMPPPASSAVMPPSFGGLPPGLSAPAVMGFADPAVGRGSLAKGPAQMNPGAATQKPPRAPRAGLAGGRTAAGPSIGDQAFQSGFNRARGIKQQ